LGLVFLYFEQWGPCFFLDVAFGTLVS